MATYNKFEYRRASHEKFNAAVCAESGGHYAVSHYLAGVSVECMLRAYRWAIDPSSDVKHDLRKLMKNSGVLEKLPAKHQSIVRDALIEIARRWTISHRYAPADRLETYLKVILARSGKRLLRDNSNEMIGFAQLVLTECDKRCP